MFKKLTKFLVSQMDPSKDLVPVESIAENQSFRPLCLLIRKSKPETTFHPDPYYKLTGFKLDDVLLPRDGKLIEFRQEDPCPFTITIDSTGEAEGGLIFSIGPADVNVKGGASSSQAFSVTPQKKSISLESLEELRRMRRINMDHSFIRQLQRTDNNLFVVVESFEASKEAVYKESTKAEGGFWVWIYSIIWGKGTKKEEQTIVIPKGCTLAFKTIQLLIRDGTWDLDYFPVEAMGISFLELARHSQGKLQVVMDEVKKHCQIFARLSPHLLLIVLNTIKAVMRDKNLLQELSQKMEELSEENNDYKLKTESPDLKNLFSTLQQFQRGHSLLLAKGITYILDALHELMEDQLLLLLESLKRNIVPQQLKLVANLLKHDLGKGKKPFRVDAGLLSFPLKEEQGLTMALVELSGVQLWEDGSAVPRHQPFEAVAALFVALYALKLLSGSK